MGCISWEAWDGSKVANGSINFVMIFFFLYLFLQGDNGTDKPSNQAAQDGKNLTSPCQGPSSSSPWRSTEEQVIFRQKIICFNLLVLHDILMGCPHICSNKQILISNCWWGYIVRKNSFIACYIVFNSFSHTRFILVQKSWNAKWLCAKAIFQLLSPYFPRLHILIWRR